MTSTRPYLIRALYEWIEDNGLTPHILVDAEAPGVTVPKQHIREGQIVLNINSSAVRDLRLGNDWIEFSARCVGLTSLAEPLVMSPAGMAAGPPKRAKKSPVAEKKTCRAGAGTVTILGTPAAST